MTNDQGVILSKKSIYTIAILATSLIWLIAYRTPSTITASISQAKGQQTTSKTSSSSNTLNFCTVESYNQGKWIYDPLSDLNDTFTADDFATANGYYCFKKFAHRCFRRSESELIRSKKITAYCWQPDSNCILLDFDPQALVKHFNDHPILFVGDSIIQLQFESLGCLLGAYYTNRHPSKSTLNGGNPKIRVDEKAPEDRDTASMAFIRSDYLLRLDDFKLTIPSDSPGTQLGVGLNYPW